jgi:hypothetical protein
MSLALLVLGSTAAVLERLGSTKASQMALGDEGI